MTIIRTITLCTLISLAMAAVAAAFTPAVVEEAERAADRELAASAEYRQAGAARQKLLRNEAIRQQVVLKTHQQLDTMQMRLDREFDLRLAKAFESDSGSAIKAEMKKEVMSRFKAEMYRYMAGVSFSTITNAYRSAEGDSGDMGVFLETTIKNNKIGFEYDIKKILNKICADLKEETGYKVHSEWIASVLSSIVFIFNQ